MLIFLKEVVTLGYIQICVPFFYNFFFLISHKNSFKTFLK